jgi:hypothetical protein
LEPVSSIKQVSRLLRRSRVIQHRKEETYSVDFGRPDFLRRPLGGCNKDPDQRRALSVSEQLDRMFPDTFEANWS